MNDLATLRATTLVCFGSETCPDSLLEQLGGENNVIVIESRRDELAELVRRRERLSPRRRQLLHLVDDAADLTVEWLDEHLRGAVKLLPPKGAPTPVDLAALRQLKASSVARQEARDRCTMTYLLMVTFNRLELTERTLERLALNTETPFRLVIADNGSHDGSAEWLDTARERYPFIERVFHYETNLGVGRALNNAAIYAGCRSRYLGRLDNDVLVPPFWLRDLQAVRDAPHRPYVVGGLVNDDPVVRRLIATAPSSLVEQLKVYDVDVVGGACNVYAPDIFARLGFFPEWPLYGVEDGGLCKAVREAGEAVQIVDNVKIEHIGSAAAPAAEAPYEHFKRNQEALFVSASAKRVAAHDGPRAGA